MPARLKNLEGKEFNKVEILTTWTDYHSGRKRHQCICKCRCGAIFKTLVDRVINGVTKSCGCYHDEVSADRISKQNFKHGGSIRGEVERLYRIWQGMIKRCEDRNCEDYKDYGGRGIVVCDEWRYDYAAFREWALDNGYSDDLSIDREENDLGYSPRNCRWATDEVQANNRRKANVRT